jgi:hypothetical protein
MPAVGDAIGVQAGGREDLPLLTENIHAGQRADARRQPSGVAKIGVPAVGREDGWRRRHRQAFDALLPAVSRVDVEDHQPRHRACHEADAVLAPGEPPLQLRHRRTVPPILPDRPFADGGLFGPPVERDRRKPMPPIEDGRVQGGVRHAGSLHSQVSGWAGRAPSRRRAPPAASSLRRRAWERAGPFPDATRATPRVAPP